MIATNAIQPNGETGNSRRRFTETKRDHLAQIIEALQPLHRQCQPAKDAAALRDYAEVLVFDDPDLSPDLIRRAAMRYLRQAQESWFPPPGLLLKFAKELDQGELPDWQHAWRSIMEASRMWDRHDAQKAIAARQHIGEPLYAFVRLLGGFIALGEVDPDTLAVLQSNFRNAFTAERTRAERNRALPEALRPPAANLADRDHALPKYLPPAVAQAFDSPQVLLEPPRDIPAVQISKPSQRPIRALSAPKDPEAERKKLAAWEEAKREQNHE